MIGSAATHDRPDVPPLGGERPVKRVPEHLGIREEERRVEAEEQQARHLRALGVALRVVVALEPRHAAEHRGVRDATPARARRSPRARRRTRRPGGSRARAPRRTRRRRARSRAGSRAGASAGPARRSAGGPPRSRRRRAPRSGCRCRSPVPRTRTTSDRGGRDDARQLRPGSCRLRHGRPRRAARDREALEQPRREVRRGEPAELAALVDAIAEPRRVAPGEDARVGEREQRDRERAGREPAEVVDRGDGIVSEGSPPGTAPTTETSRSKTRRGSPHRRRRRGCPAPPARSRQPTRTTARQPIPSAAVVGSISPRLPDEIADIGDEPPAARTATPRSRGSWSAITMSAIPAR